MAVSRKRHQNYWFKLLIWWISLWKLYFGLKMKFWNFSLLVLRIAHVTILSLLSCGLCHMIHMIWNIKISLHHGIIFGPEKYVKEVITWRHVNAVVILVHCLSLWNKRPLDSNSSNLQFWSRSNKWHIHIPSRDYLLHILFWTKNYTLVYHSGW